MRPEVKSMSPHCRPRISPGLSPAKTPQANIARHGAGCSISGSEIQLPDVVLRLDEGRPPRVPLRTDSVPVASLELAHRVDELERSRLVLVQPAQVVEDVLDRLRLERRTQRVDELAHVVGGDLVQAQLSEARLEVPVDASLVVA